MKLEHRVEDEDEHRYEAKLLCSFTAPGRKQLPTAVVSEAGTAQSSLAAHAKAERV